MICGYILEEASYLKVYCVGITSHPSLLGSEQQRTCTVWLHTLQHGHQPSYCLGLYFENLHPTSFLNTRRLFDEGLVGMEFARPCGMVA